MDLRYSLLLHWRSRHTERTVCFHRHYLTQTLISERDPGVFPAVNTASCQIFVLVFNNTHNIVKQYQYRLGDKIWPWVYMTYKSSGPYQGGLKQRFL